MNTPDKVNNLDDALKPLGWPEIVPSPASVWVRVEQLEPLGYRLDHAFGDFETAAFERHIERNVLRSASACGTRRYTISARCWHAPLRFGDGGAV